MNETSPPPYDPPTVSGPSPVSTHLTPFAIFQLVIINLLWAGSSVAAKWGLASFGPYTLAALRFLPAGILLWLLAHYEARHNAQRQGFQPFESMIEMGAPNAQRPTPNAIRLSDWPGLFVLGLSAAVTYAIFYTGLQQTNATDASLLFACEPLLIALFALIFLRERLTGAQWGGLIMGFLGVALIVGQSWGNGLAILALAIESSVSVLAKRLTDTMSGLKVIAWQLLLAAVLLAPLSLWEIAHHPPVLTWQAVGGLIFLCLINTVVCYGVWYHLLNRFSVSAMAAFILLQPMIGPFLGYFLHGDRLTSNSLAGGLCILLGIALTALRWNRKQQAGN